MPEGPGADLMLLDKPVKIQVKTETLARQTRGAEGWVLEGELLSPHPTGRTSRPGELWPPGCPKCGGGLFAPKSRKACPAMRTQCETNSCQFPALNNANLCSSSFLATRSSSTGSTQEHSREKEEKLPNPFLTNHILHAEPAESLLTCCLDGRAGCGTHDVGDHPHHVGTSLENLGIVETV